MKSLILVAGILLGSVGVVQAQAPHAMVSPAKSFDADLSAFEAEMVGLAKAMPAEKYDFVPTEDLFKKGSETDFKTVKSFGAMVKHVAQANYYYAGILQWNEAFSGYQGNQQPEEQGRDCGGADGILCVRAPSHGIADAAECL